MELDQGVRITSLLDKNAVTKCNTDCRRPARYQVLQAMGVDGIDRALWEYYRASAAKKLVYGQRANMSYGSDSYIGQLHARRRVWLHAGLRHVR